MANKSVFATIRGLMAPKANAWNREGAPAYTYTDAHALAQMAVTGTFGGMFYTKPEDELATVLALAEAVEPHLLAQVAIHARQRGHMKDMPAVLLAVLARRDPVLFRRAFGRVVDNGKMLRNFVQIVRSGQTGRKSLGSAPKAMVQAWLNGASDFALLNANIGNAPSLGDVIKMVHPKPETPEREALFAWIMGRPADLSRLPEAVQDWLTFKAGCDGPLPQVPFQMLTQLDLSADQWAQMARMGSWQMVRQNLNTFLRHGAFEDAATVDHVAALLRDPERIGKARAFPYQMMVAAKNVDQGMPAAIIDALHDAMEIAVRNVPVIAGKLVVCPDVSGSMNGSVTGHRPGATSKVRHVDVAALVAAAFLRVNRDCTVLPFENRVRDLRLEPRDTILTNAQRLAKLAGGGTNCSAPLEWLLANSQAPDLVVFVSDNQSWVDARDGGRGTAMMKQWNCLKVKNPKARLVCIDVAPYGTAQVEARADVLRIGGFSDAVFDQIAAFAEGLNGPDQWLTEIREIEV